MIKVNWRKLKKRYFLFALLFLIGVLSFLDFIKPKGQAYDFMDRFTSRDEIERLAPNAKKEIFLIGSFHFKRYFDVQPVIDQIVDFGPQELFAEAVPPNDYLEAYRNYLYNIKGKDYYTQMIDSTINFTGIGKELALKILEQNNNKVITESGDIKSQIDLANAFFISNDESNGYLQLGYIRKQVDSSDYQLLSNEISPIHLRRFFILREILDVLRPAAVELGLERIEPMDYQRDRVANDSLLNISTSKLIWRQFWKVWKLPRIIKLMKMDNEGPANDKEALEHFKILNELRFYKDAIDLQQSMLYNSNVPASIEWNEINSYRNQQMVKRISETMNKNGSDKAVVLVGASHVPHFIYEISRQMPSTKIKFLDLELLLEKAD